MGAGVMVRGESKKAGRPGFSLIEALFAVVILAVVSSGVLTLFCSNECGAILNGDQSTAMSDTQTALRSMASDMQSATGFAAPDHAGGVRVTFTSGSPVEYYQDGTTLKRLVASTGNPTSTVVAGLAVGTRLSLTYYDSALNSIAGPMDSTKYGQACVVDVTFTLSLSHASFGQVSRATRVVLRNKVS